MGLSQTHFPSNRVLRRLAAPPVSTNVTATGLRDPGRAPGLPGPRARGLSRGHKALSHPCSGCQGPSFAPHPCALRLRSAHCL
eukprot:6412206-Pyramimonas_sp.AAC.1